MSLGRTRLRRGLLHRCRWRSGRIRRIWEDQGTERRLTVLTVIFPNKAAFWDDEDGFLLTIRKKGIGKLSRNAFSLILRRHTGRIDLKAVVIDPMVVELSPNITLFVEGDIEATTRHQTTIFQDLISKAFMFNSTHRRF